MESNLNRARTLSLGTTTSEMISPPEERSLPFRAEKSYTGNTNRVRFGSDPRASNGEGTYDPTVRSASALGSTNPFSSFVHKHHHLEPLNEDDLLDSPTSDYDQPRTSMRNLQEQMNNLKGKINTLKQKSQEDRMRRRSLQALKAPSPFTDAAVASSSPYAENMRSESNSSDHSAEFLVNPSDVLKESDSAEPKTVVTTRDQDGQGSHMKTILADELQHQGGKGNHTEAPLSDEPQQDGTATGQQQHQKPTMILPSIDEDPALPISYPPAFDRGESEEPEVIIPSSPTYETDFLSPDLPPLPKSPSPAHEDRPDAFDYETYILNSTMGSFSRTGFHSRSASLSSAGSASTQRPHYETYAPNPDTNTNTHPSIPIRTPHYRTNSSDSTSTTATFATAITGRSESRANSRASTRHQYPNQYQQQQQSPPTTSTNSHLSPNFPSKTSLPNLRQSSTHQNHLTSSDPLTLPQQSQQQQQKRNSFFSPLAPSNNHLPPFEARSQILAILLRSSAASLSSSSPLSTTDPEPPRFLAPEDEALIGGVVDGLIKVVGRVLGDGGGDEGGVGRSLLESIGAVLER